jgi:hypothetical protein
MSSLDLTSSIHQKVLYRIMGMFLDSPCIVADQVLLPLDFEPVIAMVDALLELNPDAVFYTAYQERRYSALYLFVKVWVFSCVIVVSVDIAKNVVRFD